MYDDCIFNLMPYFIFIHLIHVKLHELIKMHQEDVSCMYPDMQWDFLIQRCYNKTDISVYFAFEGELYLNLRFTLIII